MIGRNAVESIAMHNEVSEMICWGMNVFLGKAYFAKNEGKKALDYLIVIATEIDDLGMVFLGHF